MNKEEEIIQLKVEKAQLSQQAKEAYHYYQLSLKKAKLAEEAYLQLKRTFVKVDSRLFSLTKGVTILPFHGPRDEKPRSNQNSSLKDLISKFSTADKARLLSLLNIRTEQQEEENAGAHSEVNNIG